MCASESEYWAKPRLIAPTPHGIRVDDAGNGRYGAQRDGGRRRHRGLDFISPPGGWVVAPCAGRAGVHGICYGDTDDYRYVRIHTPWGEVRVLYVEPSVEPRQVVEQGEIIGTAQDITARYGVLMTNHVHLEVRPIRGVLLGIEGRRPTDVVTVDPAWLMIA